MSPMTPNAVVGAGDAARMEVIPVKIGSRRIVRVQKVGVAMRNLQEKGKFCGCADLRNRTCGGLIIKVKGISGHRRKFQPGMFTPVTPIA
jgi:hypothetical protein